MARAPGIKEHPMRTTSNTAGPGGGRSRWLAAGLAAGILTAGLALAGCGGPGGAGAAVPSLGHAAGAGGSGSGSQDASGNLHGAAQCVREHGIPGFADPVRTPSGAVYSDLRSIQDAPAAALNAVRAACSGLLTQAGLNPEKEPPAPPALVQAGVRAAACERAHGLPTMQDPTARTPYTPGHGFGLTASEVPGGKLGQGFQEAGRACHVQIDAEIRSSTLSSLGSDG
jgi:hypothetical protein